MYTASIYVPVVKILAYVLNASYSATGDGVNRTAPIRVMGEKDEALIP